MDVPATPLDTQTGAMEVDHHGVIVYADRQSQELLGPGLVGRHVDDLAPRDHAKHRAAFALAPSARSMIGRALRAIRTDGEPTLVHIGLLPLSRGRVAVAVRPHVPRVYQEIEDNLCALEHELSVLSDAGRALEYLELLETQLPAMFAIGDSEGWVCVSARLAACLGWERGALIQQLREDLVHPDDLGDTVSAERRAVEAGAAGRVVARYRVFGTERWRRLRWTWKPPGPSGLTLALAEDLGDAEG